MTRSQRSALIGGLLLIGLGSAWLVFQLVPELSLAFAIDATWPLFIVALGVLLLILALVFGAPDMAVPAAIIGGIGGLLYWQNSTGNWESWAYAWTLIPGFIGLGVILSGIIGRNLKQRLQGGVILIFVSAVMFSVFGSFLGGPDLLGAYWPVLLILLGVLLLVRSVL